MSHKCHARGCNVVVPPAMFMCRSHWYSLPKPMRDAVWREYQKGQEITKTPSEAYLRVTAAAIRWLADIESKKQ
jgi:hypothetical protein